MRGGVTLGAVGGAALIAVSAHGASSAAVALRLDGVPFRPELALTVGEQQRGLMFRKRAPTDGMLFVFPRATSGGFWMKHTLVPLKIVFFDTRGRAVRTLRMTPCRADPCRIYEPGKQYRYALELPATDARPARRLGPADALRSLVSRAS